MGKVSVWGLISENKKNEHQNPLLTFASRSLMRTPGISAPLSSRRRTTNTWGPRYTPPTVS